MTEKKPHTANSGVAETDIADHKDGQSNNSGFDFEASLNELEKLVDALENGELSLEQSLQDFERGIHLTRACQHALSDAQQKVQILLEKNDQSSLEDYK